MAASGGTLDVQVTPCGSVVTLVGALNMETVADLRVTLHRLLASGSGDLIVHLDRAEVDDATGLGVLVGAHHRAMRQGRRLVIGQASARMERLLRATKLHAVLMRQSPVTVPIASAS
ncbi:STAS domain-containing protein [Ornithinimicrobium sp. Arc0846-15]|nr:STAS domain-containing protein [Ornithinimicrobium laminariae]